ALADAVEPGGLERLGAAQRRQDLLARDVPQVITDQSFLPHLLVTLLEARPPRILVDAAPALVKIGLCQVALPPATEMPIEHQAYIVPAPGFHCEEFTRRMLRFGPIHQQLRQR